MVAVAVSLSAPFPGTIVAIASASSAPPAPMAKAVRKWPASGGARARKSPWEAVDPLLSHLPDAQRRLYDTDVDRTVATVEALAGR